MRLNKYILSILSVLPIGSMAQITINQSDFPTPGTVWAEFSDSRTAVHTITAGGASQSWNYASAFVVDDTTILNFILPSSTPSGWGSNFPNSTCATYSAVDTSAQYFKSQANGFYVDGFYFGGSGGLATVTDFNPNMLLVPAQFTYQNTRTNNYLFVIDQPANPPTPGFRLKLYGIQNFNGDAYGSLVTPAGNFPNTLRVKAMQYTIDSTFIDLTGTGNYTFLNTGGPSDTTITYYWLRNGNGALLMTIDQDPVSLLSAGASYYSQGPVGLAENSGENLKNTIVFPNPAIGTQVNFEFNDVAAEVIRISDVTGNAVREVTVTGMNRVTLSTTGMQKGVYFYEVFDKQNARVSQGRFVVVK